MMKRQILAIGCAIAALTAGLAQASITFSNVMIHGSLSTGASSSTTADDIDFFLPDAFVGDGTNPDRRIGNIIITFEASSTTPINRDLLVLEGAIDLAGSGTVYYNEVVEDLVNPGVIATLNTVLDMNSDLPRTDTLVFSRATRLFKVKKTLVLTAVNTPEQDLASINLVEQRFVPEPAAWVLIGLGLPLLLRRR